ncbi:MAG TPA: hypothetical protein ACFYEK_09030 [Candidatus Wunengus sp. YC60]|uniref:hypothetical protein n=1 Tax=Candidatus Wunengus sp. YC60 TaxID=3367697 RepID=UPI004027ECD6
MANNRDSIYKKGLLVEKKNEVDELEIKAERLRKDLNYYLFSEEGIKGMEFDHARQAFEELTQTVDKYKILQAEIKRIEVEL